MVNLSEAEKKALRIIAQCNGWPIRGILSWAVRAELNRLADMLGCAWWKLARLTPAQRSALAQRQAALKAADLHRYREEQYPFYMRVRPRAWFAAPDGAAEKTAPASAFCPDDIRRRVD